MAWAERTPDLTALRDAAQRAEPVALAREQILPVLTGLEAIVAGPGLRRGTTIAVSGAVGVESLTMALVAGASQQGSWTAVVGLPSLGLVAAGQIGVALDRLAVVDAPPTSSWGAVVAALADGFDLVVLDARQGVPDRQARRLGARVRERGAVLLLVGDARGHRWPSVADVDVRTTGARWQGLGAGHGFLLTRTLTVEATGRRGATRRRRVDLQLPAPDGGLSVAPPTPSPKSGPVRSETDGLARGESKPRRFTVVA